jgi:hypothetical protein
MKNKLLTLTALAVFSINAASAGSLSTGYGSDVFRRGSLIAEDSLQTSASYDTSKGGFDVSVGAQTAHSAGADSDVYILSGGIGKSLGSLLSVYGGLEHFEQLDGASNLDVVLSADFDTLLSPTLSAARNIDESQYTFEAGVSYDISINNIDLSVRGTLGNTDLNTGDNIDYYSVGISASKNLAKNLVLSLSADQVNSDAIESDCIVAAALTASF